jgi:hypothetical protein
MNYFAIDKKLKIQKPVRREGVGRFIGLIDK